MNIDHAYKPSITGEDSIHLTGEFDFNNDTPALQVANQLRERTKQLGGYVAVYDDKSYFEVRSAGYRYECYYGDVEDYKEPHVKKIITFHGDEKIDETTIEQLFRDYELGQKILENVEFSIG